MPSHFDKGSLTVGALDNFDNADKNSLSGMEHAHDTAMAVFQVKSNVIASKPKKSTVTSVQNLNKLPCQEIANSRFNQKLSFDNSFSVEDELPYSNEEVIYIYIYIYIMGYRVYCWLCAEHPSTNC